MRIPINLRLVTYIHSSKLQETYETLLAIKKVSTDDDPDSVFNQFFEQVQDKLNYLKNRQREIEERLEEEKQIKELKEIERKKAKS
jgi:hypothetical protein